MKSMSSGILAVLIVYACVAPAGAQVEPPYDPTILPQEYAGPPLPIKEPDSMANSGAARLSYPIAVPPGRRGISPRLSLEYNSGGRNGIAGVGWSLSTGAIQRSTRNGLTYAGTAFEHDGEELAARPDWGPGFYGAKREERFSKYQLTSASSGWVMTTRDGVCYSFGSQAGSRQENPFGVFQWWLDRVEDTNGNHYLITYTKDQGQIYPAQIVYTGNGQLSPTHSIVFTYTSRPDAVESYQTKTRVVTAKRLSTITTKANGQTARSYTLVYENGRSGRSRLKQIKADPLPPVSFTYQEGSDGTFSRRITAATEGDNAAGFVFHGPCDSDGYPDLIKFSGDSTAPYVYTYLSDGSGGYSAKLATRLAGSANRAGFLLVADFDTDGWVDIVKVEPAGTSGTVYFHKGLGNGAFAPAVRSDLGGINDSGRILVGDVIGQDGRLELIKLKSLSGQVTVHRLQGNGVFEPGVATNLGATVDTGRMLVMDCNGDRRDDLVRTDMTSRIFVHLSRGDGTFGAGIQTDLGNGPNDPGRLMTGDFNGDGLPDLLKIKSLSSRVYVHFSLGTGSFGQSLETDLKGPAIDAGRILVADVDHDGNQDILRHYYNSTVVDCYRSEGDGTFQSSVATTLGGGPPYKGYVATSNVDGSGGADLILRDRFGNLTTFTSSPNVPDLLIKAANGLGATYSFSFKSSAEYDNLYLPFNVETLAAVTVQDGNGVASTREYSYSGGSYDPVDAEFRGFGKMEEVLPDGTLRETTFHQDEYLAGREQQVDRRDPADRLLTKTTLTWTAEPQYGLAHSIHLKTRQLEHFFDPPVVSRWDHVYSGSHGGVLSSVQSGSGAEAITTSFSYRNCGYWNWRTDRETLRGGNGAIVRDTFFTYDGRGNKTAEEKWNDSGNNPVSRWTYDAFGNTATKIDARGYTTGYEYDGSTFTYPSKIILPQTGSVIHVWKVPEFDFRVGKAKTLEDPNGNRTFYEYDSIGRLLQAIYPDGGRKTHTYVQSTFPSHVKTNVHDGTATPIAFYDYFDGLGRKIQTVAYGEKGKPVHSRWYYDNLGRNYRREGPYFAGSGEYSWTKTEYDFWDRPVSVKRPDGEHGIVMTNYAYDGLTATATDPDGAGKTTTKDYLDRVTRVEEHSDQGDIVTEFDYNAAGDLLKITNHAGIATRFERDSLGNVRAMSDPDMGSWEYTYDANGNLKTQTDSKLQTVTLEYDPLNRLISKTYSTSNTPVSYTYDNPSVPNGIGRLHTVSNSHASISNDEYDEMGRQIGETRRFAGNPTGYATRREYDPAGNLTAIIYPLDGYRVEYSYHPGTRLIHRVTGPGGVEFAELEDYTAEGKPGFLYQGNGTSTTFSHDLKANVLKAIRIQAPSLDPADDIFHKAYRYTPGGDIKEITDHIQSSTRYYTYDKLHRLVSEKSSNVPLVHPSKVVRLKYDYEGTGPFHAPKRIESRGRTHDLQYDANGNLVDGPALADPQSITRRAIRYTPDNMPSRIDQPGARCAEGQNGGACPDKVEFLYDAANKRAIKTSTAGKTYYVGRHFEVYNGIPTRHIFAGDLRLAKVTPNGILHFHKDHLINTVAVTDDSGKRIESTDYIPFGQGRNRSGDWSTTFRYTDQEFDCETGLHNYKARLYDPMLAIFKSPDPHLSANLVFSTAGRRGSNKKFSYGNAFSEKPGDSLRIFKTKELISFFSSSSQNLNRYAYAQNSPINFVDINGLWPERIHNQIIGIAFMNLPENLISQIEKGSAFADSKKFQVTSFSYMHAMRQKGESVEDASVKMHDYINEHFENLNTFKEVGQIEKAYFELGMALHPIMDSTSPSHQGFQEWSGALNSTGYGLISHWIQEQILSSDQLSITIELINQAMSQ
jgi:RHS repeat-associated protein